MAKTDNIEVTIQEENAPEVAAMVSVPEAQAEEPALSVPADPLSSPNRVQLSHPYEWEGKTIDHIDVDLSKVSGRDCKTISRILESTGEVNPMAVLPEFTIPYILQLVAYAARLPIEFLESLDWPDVMRLKVKVIGFFGA